MIKVRFMPFNRENTEVEMPAPEMICHFSYDSGVESVHGKIGWRR